MSDFLSKIKMTIRGNLGAYDSLDEWRKAESPVCEMTAEEVARVVQLALLREPLQDAPYAVAHNLAKLGTIRVVEGK